jgi:hypothetical protein
LGHGHGNQAIDARFGFRRYGLADRIDRHPVFGCFGGIVMVMGCEHLSTSRFELDRGRAGRLFACWLILWIAALSLAPAALIQR